jgi:hypothetical protein
MQIHTHVDLTDSSLHWLRADKTSLYLEDSSTGFLSQFQYFFVNVKYIRYTKWIILALFILWPYEMRFKLYPHLLRAVEMNCFLRHSE